MFGCWPKHNTLKVSVTATIPARSGSKNRSELRAQGSPELALALLIIFAGLGTTDDALVCPRVGNVLMATRTSPLALSTDEPAARLIHVAEAALVA